jgi:hypothetical protein
VLSLGQFQQVEVEKMRRNQERRLRKGGRRTRQ